MTCVTPRGDRPVTIEADQPDYDWSDVHDFGHIEQEHTYWSLPDAPRAAEGSIVRFTVSFIGNEGGDGDPEKLAPGVAAYTLQFITSLGFTDEAEVLEGIPSHGDCFQEATVHTVDWTADRYNLMLDNPPDPEGPPPNGPGIHLVVDSYYHKPNADPQAACMGDNVFAVEIGYLAAGELVGRTLPVWTEDLCPTAVFARMPEYDAAGQDTGRWLFVTTHPIRVNGADYVGFNADPCRHHLARRVVGDNGQSWLEYCSTPHPDHDQFKRAHRAYRCAGPIDGAGIDEGRAAWAGTYHAPFWTEAAFFSQPQVCDVPV